MPPKVALAFGWVTLIWGCGWLATKVTLVTFSPLFLAGSRYIGAALVLGLLARMAGASPPRRRAEWGVLLGTGTLTTGICTGLVFWGQSKVTSGLASLLFASMPLFTALIADRVLPGEPLTSRRLLGILVGLLGVAIVGGASLVGGAADEPAAYLIGALAVVAGAMTFAGGLVWLKQSGAEFHPLVAVAVQSVAGALVLLPISYVLEPVPIVALSPFAVAMFLHLTFVQSCLTQVVWMWLIKRVEATRIAYISCIVPAIAVLAGAAVLGEPLTWSLAVGGVAVVLGLWLVNRPVATAAAPLSDGALAAGRLPSMRPGR